MNDSVVAPAQDAKEPDGRHRIYFTAHPQRKNRASLLKSAKVDAAFRATDQVSHVSSGFQAFYQKQDLLLPAAPGRFRVEMKRFHGDGLRCPAIASFFMSATR